MIEINDSLIITCSVCSWEIDPLNYCVKNGKVICHRCEMSEEIKSFHCECSNSNFEKIREEVHEHHIKIIVACLYCSKKHALEILYTSREQKEQAERIKE